MRRIVARTLLGASVLMAGLIGIRASGDSRLTAAYRRPPQDGWTYVHLAGSPAQVGYQHGYLLASEIQDLRKLMAVELSHDLHKEWAFFREAARGVLWPHVDQEYRDEMTGIADGQRAQGGALDVWDIVAMNAFPEWSYYVSVYDQQHTSERTAAIASGEHCSAFVATGSYTADGRPVIAHNNWSSYADGARWTMVFDVTPASGLRFVMDGLPGLIHSGDDFGVNAANIVITETTISRFKGYDAGGIPEFVRARKALQYGTSIDEVAQLFKTGNNGGYANDWLIADMRRNEIASLELGLKHVTLERKTDGYFVGSNFPINPQLASEETTFKTGDPTNSANARHTRWQQLMTANKGRIDVAHAEAFLADHVDSVTGRIDPNERTLCGHIDLSPRGVEGWVPSYATAGAVQNKATDATLAGQLSFMAAAGHACGIGFSAASHLGTHPELAWQQPVLRDLPAGPWTLIRPPDTH
jgi:Phospholipase B